MQGVLSGTTSDSAPEWLFCVWLWNASALPHGHGGATHKIRDIVCKLTG
jgi:hypothetical protein